jgi:hypothetical protein
VRLDKGTLDRMQGAAAITQIFHSNQLLSVKHWEEQETGVKRGVTDCPSGREFADHDGARPAISLGTPFLHSCMSWKGTEIIKYSRRRTQVIGVPELERDNPPVHDK